MSENIPFWSWPLELVTLFMPAKQGIHPALKDVELVTLDREEFNQRHVAQAEALGRETRATGTERVVEHTGGQLDLRERAIFLQDIFDALDGVNYWGRMVTEPGKGTKVEIRTTEPYPTTTGVIPTEALEAFVADVRERTVSVRAVWVNPNPHDPKRFFANLVVSTKDLQPEEIRQVPTDELPEESNKRQNVLVNPNEMFVFIRDNMPRLGSEKLKPRQPNY